MNKLAERSVLAVIIGRAGSKGLPGKNALPLAGRPLICHTIEDALKATWVNRVIVSTDGREIADAAESLGVQVIMRPAELASDTATVDAAVRHAVEHLERDEPQSRYEIIVILYANVPLRPDDLIDRAVMALIETQADSVQSYSAVGKNHPYWMVRLNEPPKAASDGNSVQQFIENTVYRRQDLPQLYMPDGGVIAVSRESLFTVVPNQPHAFLGKDRRSIVSPAGAVVDIDEPLDFAVAQSVLASQCAQRHQTHEIEIGSTRIGTNHAPYVISELGVNHDGCESRLLELVRSAARAKANAVKLQAFSAERLVGASAKLAAYQQRNAKGSSDVHEMLASLEMSEDSFRTAIALAHDLGLHAIVTIFNIDLVQPLAQLDWDAFKVASPDVINKPLLSELMRYGKGRPLLVSAGAATLAEVCQATKWLGDCPHIVLQCVSAYPVPAQHASLAARLAMMQVTPYALGYSDHTTEIDTGALAVASGARLLEKHLTHDRNAAGPDHAASLDGPQFAQYVTQAHRAFDMMGQPVKRVLEIEREVRTLSRQSITAARALERGRIISRDDVTIMRPGTGLPPADLERVIGRRIVRNVAPHVPLMEADVDWSSPLKRHSIETHGPKNDQIATTCHAEARL